MTAAVKNIRKLYALTALMNLWFFTGSWLYFYRLYMSDRQIGVLDGMVFALGLVAEVPAGALADLLGRKRQLQVGLLLMSAGFLLQGFAQAYWYMLVGMSMFTVGAALVSGADDALVYDALEAEGKADGWQQVISRKFQIMHIVTLGGYLAGGLLSVLLLRLPFILSGVGMLFGFFVATSFHEVRETHAATPVFADFVRQNAVGIKYFLRRHMWLYGCMALIVLGIGYAFDLGVIKPLMLDSFGYKKVGQAVANALAGGVAIIALTQLDRLRKSFGEKRGLVLLALCLGAGFLAAAFHVGMFGILAFLLIGTAASLVGPWLNDVVQHEASSAHRATALSAMALLQKMPYIVLAPLAGIFSTNGHLGRYFMGVALSVFAAVAVLLLFGILNKQVQKRAVAKARQAAGEKNYALSPGDKWLP